MTKNVYSILEVAVKPGRFEDFKTLIADLVEATQD
jgi:hypothetical protein